jgi:hypothetical protein
MKHILHRFPKKPRTFRIKNPARQYESGLQGFFFLSAVPEKQASTAGVVWLAGQ